MSKMTDDEKIAHLVDKIRNPNKTSFDEMAKMLDKLWFDKIPLSSRKVTITVSDAQMELFDKVVTEEFGI